MAIEIIGGDEPSKKLLQLKQTLEENAHPDDPPCVGRVVKDEDGNERLDIQTKEDFKNALKKGKDDLWKDADSVPVE